MITHQGLPIVLQRWFIRRQKCPCGGRHPDQICNGHLRSPARSSSSHYPNAEKIGETDRAPPQSTWTHLAPAGPRNPKKEKITSGPGPGVRIRPSLLRRSLPKVLTPHALPVSKKPGLRSGLLHLIVKLVIFPSFTLSVASASSSTFLKVSRQRTTCPQLFFITPRYVAS